MTDKRIVILGGGTISHVRNHLALCAPAYGRTARRLFGLCGERFENMSSELMLSKMAGQMFSAFETPEDVEQIVDELITDNTVKVVFFNVAMVDFKGQIGEVESGKYAERLSSRQDWNVIRLEAYEKVVKLIREKRKDIFLVAFKTTCDDHGYEMFAKGLNLLKEASCNLVLVNDTITHRNMIITPEEGCYDFGGDRQKALSELVDMTWHRTHLSFTRSTVVDGTPVPWSDERVYPALREVVNYCVSAGAYKKFRGVTTGHFAAKIGENRFLTSIRKTNFNDIEKNGMVLVTTNGPDNVISYGAKPSVGGQSQRIIFDTYKDLDCIVHFHCPLNNQGEGVIPVVSQREYECGSHECGQNTADGLIEVWDGIYCVMLDKHGPNIVFNHNKNPKDVIDFIRYHFDLSKSTSGFEQVYFK